MRRSRKYLSHLWAGIHPRVLPGMYSQGIPIVDGISAMPPATETSTGLALPDNSRATADARAKWPIPIPLLVARMIVGLATAQHFS